ncbi:MAG TPA: cupin domain-containing protein [Ilumatobacteraceae bacterium]
MTIGDTADAPRPMLRTRRPTLGRCGKESARNGVSTPQANAKRSHDPRQTEPEPLAAASDRHFFFHTTHTLDYAIVLDGEIWAMMDEGETLMKRGDVLIQRATNHSWSNRTNRDCNMAFVLIDGARGGRD